MSKSSVKCRNWIVRVKCEVTKEVICFDCTQEQAKKNPFQYAEEERETGQQNWKVTSIEPNE